MHNFYCTYSNWIKFRLTTLSIPICIIIMGIVYYYEIDILIPLAITCLMFLVNLTLDIKNLKFHQQIDVGVDGLTTSNQIIKWEDIEEAWWYGPSLNNKWKMLAQKFYFTEGIVLVLEEDEFVVFKSARNFKKLVSSLETEDVELKS